jgi:cell division protein FtsZ
MPIELTMPELTEMTPRITVIGVGGAGGNAINNMIEADLQGVDFVAANTDAQALASSLATRKIQLGAKITQGLGAGAKPDVGAAAAEETHDILDEALNGSHMVFITAGMGGGTGTGAAPIVAQMAKERGILTVGVVTKPFHFEGSRRMSIADTGIIELQKYVDTLIIIPNQNLFRIANEKTTFADAFTMADQVLHSGVRGITDLMVMPGLINLDFADIRTVMNNMGKAMMGTGEAEGDNRAVNAAEAAISNPLLDEVSMSGAQGVIINITGGMDLTLFEVDEAANYIRNQVDPDANIIVGSAFNQELDGLMRVSVVATGLDEGDGGPRVMKAQPGHTTVGGITRTDPEAPSSSEPAPKESQEVAVEPLEAPETQAVPEVKTAPAAEAVKPEGGAEIIELTQVHEDTSKGDEDKISPLESKMSNLVSSVKEAAERSNLEPIQDIEIPQTTDIEDEVVEDVFVASEAVQPTEVVEPLGAAYETASEALISGEVEGVDVHPSANDLKAPSSGDGEALMNDEAGAKTFSLFERLTMNFRTEENSNAGVEPSMSNPKEGSVSLAEKQTGEGSDDMDIPSFLKDNGKP